MLGDDARDDHHERSRRSADLNARAPQEGHHEPTDDGRVDAVGRGVGELDQQQQLREGIVLERDACGQPALGDAQQLREEPGLVIVVVIAEVLL